MSGDTIYAPASGPGKGGVKVVRISGPRAGDALTAVTGRLPPARRAVLAHIRDRHTGEALDEGLALWFPAPASFTGEDMAELHVHGGRAVIDGVLQALGRVEGLRAAEPGEFSRRAFINGRMDLTAAEAIADLVEAETAAQRRQALRQMEGALAGLYGEWGETLKRTVAHFEAAIDFSDEGLPEEMEAEARRDMDALAAAIAAHLDDARRGERLRDGIHVAIVGAPNSGKSSLLNQLARRDAAIVAETAGTTRDVIDVHLDLDGYPVVLADTAGLRDASDEIEREGVRRAIERARASDLKVVVVDGAGGDEPDDKVSAMIDADTIVAFNKIDLEGSRAVPAFGEARVVKVSARTGEGIGELLDFLSQAVGARIGASETPALTRRRHREALEACRGHLARAREGVKDARPPEIVAEDLRLALRDLGRITGRVGVEDLLDVIFRDFCIGK